MDKNTVIGFLLIAAVLIGYSWYARPSEEELQAQQEQIEKEEAAAKAAAAAKKKEAAKKSADLALAREDTTAFFHNALVGTSSDVVLKNEKLELTLSSKGGTVTKAVVKGFKDKEEHPDVTLFEGKEQSLDFSLEGKEMNLSSQDLYFTPSEQTDSTVTFTASDGHGHDLVMTYLLGPDYMLHFSFRAKGMEGLFSPKTKTMNVSWHEDCKQQEKGHSFENRYATLTYKEKGAGTDYLNETQEKKETLETPIDWIAFKSQFFSAMMIAKDEFATGAKLSSVPQDKSTGYLKKYDAELETFFDPKGETSVRGEREPFRQGLEDGAFGISWLAFDSLHQPLVHALCLRLAHQIGSEHGHRLDSHHAAAEGHHLPDGEEELHEFSQDARVAPEN